MWIWVRTLVLGVALLVFAGLAYAGKGALDAYRDAPRLRAQAEALIAGGRGPQALGAQRLAQLLRVQDPGFLDHAGIDLTTPGAGATTVTQSLSKRLAFDQFQPGLRKIRQTGYALGLERSLTKPQILALWLDTTQMGHGPQGWMTGVFTASQQIYGKPPAALDQGDYLQLIAVLIAPSRYDLRQPDAGLIQRSQRIARLLQGQCAPRDHGDVWFQDCDPPQ